MKLRIYVSVLLTPLALSCGPRSGGPPTTPQTSDGGGAQSGTSPDIWEAPCAEQETGELFTEAGQLLFRPASPEAQCEEEEGCLRRRQPSGRSYWQHSAVMIRDTGAVLSGLVPGDEPNEALAVGTLYTGPLPFGTVGMESEPVGRDELLLIRGSDMTFTGLWENDSRLLMMGKVGHRVVLLTWNGSEAAFAAVSSQDMDAIESAPVEVDRDRFCFLPDHPYFCARSWITDASRNSAPIGPNRFVVLCSDDHLCVVTVGEREIEVETTALQQGTPRRRYTLYRHGDGLVLRFYEHGNWQDHQCISSDGGDPSEWAAGSPGPCPDDLGEPGGAIAVDGVPAGSVPMSPPACLVRSDLWLPPLGSAEGSPEEGCQLVMVDPPEGYDPWGENDEGEDGLRPFRRILASGGCSLGMGYGEYGLALTRETVEYTVDRERGMYLVQLSPPTSPFGLSDCTQAPLWLRLTSSAEPPATELRTLEWEYGYCE